jgi:hypothetical protein
MKTSVLFIVISLVLFAVFFPQEKNSITVHAQSDYLIGISLLIFLHVAGGYLTGLLVAIFLSRYHTAAFIEKRLELYTIFPVGQNPIGDFVYNVTFKNEEGEIDTIPMTLNKSSNLLILGPIRKIVTMALRMDVVEGEPSILRIEEDDKINQGGWVFHPYTDTRFIVSLPKSVIESGYQFSILTPSFS